MINEIISGKLDVNGLTDGCTGLYDQPSATKVEVSNPKYIWEERCTNRGRGQLRSNKDVNRAGEIASAVCDGLQCRKKVVPYQGKDPRRMRRLWSKWRQLEMSQMVNVMQNVIDFISIDIFYIRRTMDYLVENLLS